MLPGKIRIPVEVALILAVATWATVAYAGSRAKFDGDEAEWIGTSKYFHTLFVARDLSQEAWADSYWTRTQPMMARYAIGAWLWWQGHDLPSFEPYYDHNRNWAENLRRGWGPSDELLTEARQPMRWLAAATAVVLYLLVRALAGPLGGLAAVGLMLGSPYLREHLIRAKGDTTLMLFLLGGVLCGVLALRGTGRWRLIWCVASGVALGLAMGSKLTGVLAIVGVGVTGAVIFIFTRSPRPFAATAAVIAIALVAFVASSPYLYSDPIGRTLLMFENRGQEMAVQMATEPYKAITSPLARLENVLERSLVHETWGMSYHGLPIEAALAGVGLVALARGVARRQPADLLALCVVLAVFGGISWGLGYRQQHYFVPTTMMALVLAGVGVGRIVEFAWSATRRDYRPAVRKYGAAPAAIIEPVATISPRKP
jgi:hypothetical protein